LSRRERGEVLQGLASGSPSLFDAKQIGQGEKGFQNPWTPERDPQQILFSPFGRLERERKEREDIKQRLGGLSRIQIQI
jgi:hypothetical protein